MYVLCVGKLWLMITENIAIVPATFDQDVGEGKWLDKFKKL